MSSRTSTVSITLACSEIPDDQLILRGQLLPIQYDIRVDVAGGAATLGYYDPDNAHRIEPLMVPGRELTAQLNRAVLQALFQATVSTDRLRLKYAHAYAHEGCKVRQRLLYYRRRWHPERNLFDQASTSFEVLLKHYRGKVKQHWRKYGLEKEIDFSKTAFGAYDVGRLEER